MLRKTHIAKSMYGRSPGFAQYSTFWLCT